MPSKSKNQAKKARASKIAKRGKDDLAENRITPRAVRFGLKDGKYAMRPGKPPAPPSEWKDWKRDSFQLSVQAGWMFLQGRELDQIAPVIGKASVTRQRLAQMVGAGVKFLLDRKFVSAVE